MDKRTVMSNAETFYSKVELARLFDAIDCATKMHEGQTRKSGEPYITHPLSVANFLIDWGMDIDTVCAGVLHDTIEDTELTLEQVKQQFGDSIAFLVDGVTKISKARAGMRDLDSYLPQTKDNLSKLLVAVSQDVRVIIIKLADRLHNLQTLRYMNTDKQIKIARESLEVFGPMADRLGMGRVRMEIEDKAFSHLDPKEYQRVNNLLRKRLGKSTRKLGTVRQEIEKCLQDEGIEFEINGRIKSIYSLYKKLKKVDGNIDDIYDLMALRIIVDKNADCYRVLGILHGMYQPMINRIKDYIAIPKPNGYQSLHTTVITPNSQIIEFQIRTHTMHEYAERGLAASFHYNMQKDSKDYFRRSGRMPSLPTQLQWITQLQEVAARLRSGDTIPHKQLDVDLFSDRIFVFSPRGDIFNLPEGALPLDFAYMVHSDIAKHAYSFKVNGNIHAFDKPLKNGDVVEVVTRKLSLPRSAWLDMIRTSHARDKLRAQLRSLQLIDTLSGTARRVRTKLHDKGIKVPERKKNRQ